MVDRNTAVHQPVLLREVQRVLELNSGMVVIDGTVGAGGHSRMIANHIGSEGMLIGLDRDPMMLRLAAAVLPKTDRVILKQASYADAADILKELKIPGVDRMLLDLGLSSDQLADEARGFGFKSEKTLDLRFDISQGKPAHQLLATIDVDSLESLLREYGEEPESARIARFLVSRAGAIQTGSDLANAVMECLGVKRAETKDRHPATRVFQALRIAVNCELDHVKRGLEFAAFESLKPGGLVAVISFHSLEDRIVKYEFRRSERWESLTAKPIVATYQEHRVNPRSRSAKLRVARKIG